MLILLELIDSWTILLDSMDAHQKTVISDVVKRKEMDIPFDLSKYSELIRRYFCLSVEFRANTVPCLLTSTKSRSFKAMLRSHF